MILLDKNIIIYAFMSVLPEQGRITYWLENALNSSEPHLALCESSILAFLRISTNPVIFNPPLPLSEANKIIHKLLTHPNVRVLHPGPEHFRQLAEIMQKHGISADLTMDAHLCVLALRFGAKIATLNTDFVKLPYVGLINPLND